MLLPRALFLPFSVGDCHDPAGPHFDDAIREGRRVSLIVGDVYRRHMERALQASELAPKGIPQLGVEARECATWCAAIRRRHRCNPFDRGHGLFRHDRISPALSGVNSIVTGWLSGSSRWMFNDANTTAVAHVLSLVRVNATRAGTPARNVSR